MGKETRRSRGLIVIAAMLALALCAAPSAHARDLKRGAKGPRVAFVQKVLGLHADRIYGKQTKRAVKRFQRRHGLTADGIVGPATWSALGHPGVTKVLKRRRGATRSTGGLPIVVRRVIAAANRIAHKPYRYGGGHGSFLDTGYDCSGSVSYALHGGGLLSAPQDSGQLMSYGAAGPGRYITIYSQPGHVYMVVHGRRFDTSGQDAGSRWQWDMRASSGYTVRHPPGL